MYLITGIRLAFKSLHAATSAVSVFGCHSLKGSFAILFAIVPERMAHEIEWGVPETLPPSPPLQRPTIGLGDEYLSKERDVEMADPEQRDQGARRDAAKEMGNSDTIFYPPSPILRPTGPGAMNDPPFSLSNDKSSIGYAEYIFTREYTVHVGQDEIRQVFYKKQTQASQADLESQIEESRRSGSTGLD